MLIHWLRLCPLESFSIKRILIDLNVEIILCQTLTWPSEGDYADALRFINSELMTSHSNRRRQLAELCINNSTLRTFSHSTYIAVIVWSMYVCGNWALRVVLVVPMVSTRCLTSRTWSSIIRVRFCGFRRQSTRPPVQSMSSTFRSTNNSVTWSSDHGHSMETRSVCPSLSFSTWMCMWGYLIGWLSLVTGHSDNRLNTVCCQHDNDVTV